MKQKKKRKNVSSIKTRSVKERTAKPNIVKMHNAVVSLIKNNIYHYNMLMALQTQVLCLEAKIKLLEEKVKRI